MGTRRGSNKAARGPRRPARKPEPLTDAQDKRYSLMRRAGVEQQAIADKVKADTGRVVSRQTVGSVIRNKFVNDDVVDAFCALTGASREDAWPDVPLLEPGEDRRTGTEG
jgi:hypothetical protein